MAYNISLILDDLGVADGHCYNSCFYIFSRMGYGPLSSYSYGLWGETWVCLILRFRGFRILARRYRNTYGEVDIIALRGDWLRFIEVKSRSSRADFFHPACTPRQLGRVKRAAQAYLSQHPFSGRISVDVFYVYRAFAVRSIINV